MKDKKNIHGFKAPEDYFESFEERLFNRLDEEGLPKVSGFNVPEGYFSTVENNIFQRLDTSENKTKIIPIYRRQAFLYVASIAACAIIIFSLIPTKPEPNNTIKEVQLSSIDRYIEEGNLDLDLYDLMAMLEDKEIGEISFVNNMFSEENLEDYLMDNLDDTSLLIE